MFHHHHHRTFLFGLFLSNLMRVWLCDTCLIWQHCRIKHHSRPADERPTERASGVYPYRTAPCLIVYSSRRDIANTISYAKMPSHNLDLRLVISPQHGIQELPPSGQSIVSERLHHLYHMLIYPCSSSTIPTSSSSTASPESRRLASLSRYLRSACLITASVEPGRDFSRLKAPARILIRSFRPYGLTGIQAFSCIINYSGVKKRRTFKLGEVARVLPGISRSSKREVASSISSRELNLSK